VVLGVALGDGRRERLGVGVGVAFAVLVGVGVAVAVALGAGTPSTVIVPCIVEWIWQWYAKVPACVNRRWKLPPGGIVPESNNPSSDVTVWLVDVSIPVSSFVQRTFVPAPTWTTDGW
jgi:hypothetical protein